MSPGTLKDRQYEKAAQKVREARHNIADIPTDDRGFGDYLALMVLAIVEEGLSVNGTDDEDDE